MYVDMPTGMFFLTIGTASFLGGLASLFLLVKILGLGRVFGRRKASPAPSGGATTEFSEEDIRYVEHVIDETSHALRSLYSITEGLPNSEIIPSEHPYLQGHERRAALDHIKSAENRLTSARSYSEKGLRSHIYTALTDARMELWKIPYLVGGPASKTANNLYHDFKRTIERHVPYDPFEYDAERLILGEEKPRSQAMKHHGFGFHSDKAKKRSR